MALSDPLAITYNAVVKNLARVNSGDPYTTVYYLDDSANLMRFTCTVKHTIPSKTGQFDAESHLMRLDVEFLNANILNQRTVSSWLVMKNVPSIAGYGQDFVTSQRVQAALLTAATVANTDKLLGRQG